MGPPPPATPSKQKEDPRTTINHLNSRWKLDLREADLCSSHSKSAEVPAEPSQLCVKIVRFLFYQNRPALERVISDFEEWARGIASAWRWKPRQERGTLPLRQPEESMLLVEKVDMTESKRAELIAHLVDLLKDECYLLKKGPPEFKPSGRAKGTATFLPEVQGAEQASPLKNFPRNKSFSALEAEEKQKQSEPKPRKKRKSLDNEVFSIFDTSIFDDFDPEPFNPTSGNVRVSDQNDHHDTNYDEVQTENVPPPKTRSSRSSKSSKTSIRDFFPAPKDLPAPKIPDTPHFALPPLPSLAPSASLANKRSSENLGLSFTSIISTGSVFDAPDTLEPSTQDTEASIFNDLFESFESDQNTTANGQLIGSVGGDIGQQANEGGFRQELEESGPFRKSAIPPPSIPLRYTYEASRMASSWNKSLNDLGNINTEGYSSFWEWANGRGKLEQKPLPVRSSLRAWEAAVDAFNGGDPNSSVQLTGSLDWVDSKRQGIFDLHLNPLKIETSCRLHRKFGPDRFLSLSLPALERNYFPEHIQKNPKVERKEISDWLSLSEHHILGRVWRAFFVEEEKNPKTTGTTTFKYKVHFFAIKGEGISEIPITELINWHIPLVHNAHSTECKIFQRFSLGLSKASLAAVLTPSEFIYLPDVTPVMNDGCARMSKSLARHVADSLCLGCVPSVFQARIAGGKGLWMVVDDIEFEGSGAVSERGFFIEISDSQLKIHPHPKDLSEKDTEKLGFEVVTFSKSLISANVNPQLVSILQDRGVNLNRLKQLQLDDLQSIYDPLIASKDDRLNCRQWVQTHARTTATRGANPSREILRKGALPASMTDIAALLLESGFEPRGCSFLTDQIKAILGDHLSRHVERLHIKVPLSTYAFCIADPYKCLAPDEVHFGFSKNWDDLDFADIFLDGRDVLLARLPAHLPSDIQKRKAVWKKQLHHFKDVIVFPTTGNVPLADLLSGGDYDGDQPWICWDPEIVDSFQNVDKDPQPEFKYFGITKNSMAMVKTTREIDGFLSRCFDFNLNPTFLGLVSAEHEKVQYHEKDGVSCREAKELAVLAGLLVDAPKQGYSLSGDAWHKFLGKVSPRARFVPAYKHVEDGPDGFSKTQVSKPQESNYLDFLKFWVAVPQKEIILKNFHDQWGGAETKKDADISRVWQNWWLEAEAESKRGRPELQHVLEQLRKDINRLRDKWTQKTTRTRRGKGSGEEFEANVQALHDDMRAIEPMKVDHALVEQVRREERQGVPPSQSVWNWLRASCAYEFSYKGKFSWYVAGETLCSIKASAGEEEGKRVRAMREDIYVAMKIDGRAVKRIQQRDQDQEDEGEGEWEDDETEEVMLGLVRSGVWE